MIILLSIYICQIKHKFIRYSLIGVIILQAINVNFFISSILDKQTILNNYVYETLFVDTRNWKTKEIQIWLNSITKPDHIPTIGIINNTSAVPLNGYLTYPFEELSLGILAKNPINIITITYPYQLLEKIKILFCEWFIIEITKDQNKKKLLEIKNSSEITHFFIKYKELKLNSKKIYIFKRINLFQHSPINLKVIYYLLKQTYSLTHF